VMRALQRDQRSRWPSAGDMLAALNKYLYSLDTTPGPRDLAALVARFCPPETRRLPTHVEAAGDGEAESEPPVRGGPATAVIPRDAVARGKPKRHQSFATNIDLAPLLGGDDVAHEDPRATDPRPAVRAVPTTAVSDAPIPRPPPAPLPVPGRNAPSMQLLVMMGLGMLALGAAAIFVFFRGRDAVLATDRDAAVVADAPALVLDTAPPVDAAVADAPPADAAVPDSPPPHRADAALRPDARSVDAAVVTPAGSATLKVGADPWGEIYVDGKPMGRTPRELAVTAGHHTVEIVFPAETPPRKQTFAVDLADGETKPLQADFTN